MLKAIQKRRSVREYLNKEIEKEKIEEILKAAMTAPSAHNRRPWRFWLVRDKEKKEKLAQIQPWASFVAEAPVVLVIGSEEDKRWVENCAVVAALVYLEATNQGLGTCWVQVKGMRTEKGEESEGEVKKLLGIEENIRILCLMPLGYPSKVLPEHSRKIEKEKLIEK